MALHKKGWIAAARRRFKEAETWLNKAVAMRPYSADSFIERGYLLTQMRRYDEGLKSYETAIELARTVPIEKVLEPAALRGLGFTLIELNNLPRARRAFRESLGIEPMNRIARGELMYIDGLEKKWAEQEIGDLRRRDRWAEVTAKLDRRIEAAPEDTYGAAAAGERPGGTGAMGRRRLTSSRRSSSSSRTARTLFQASLWLSSPPGEKRNTGEPAPGWPASFRSNSSLLRSSSARAGWLPTPWAI